MAGINALALQDLLFRRTTAAVKHSIAAILRDLKELQSKCLFECQCAMYERNPVAITFSLLSKKKRYKTRNPGGATHRRRVLPYACKFVVGVRNEFDCLPVNGLQIQRWTEVGKYNALSGNTASGCTAVRPNHSATSARRRAPSPWWQVS